eukprot:CAMPEP_0202962526 /NCGR_PEP_ID=MMETSP1396-20130829/6634_1 /ASSEMBLY_ACC=CAM_ASM_000872 /TAXON_ID= /ORGANISM="Pseudokeronopsis sp., Strain Brazil" /LENGTH=161 /DNA_ID=CAMNT_0049683175 /DNA_START=730 /DNA_END=1215 /DNA_ORIENTATION=-
MTKKVSLTYLTKIEDNANTTICNFANEYIGGGALGSSTAQEECLFLIFPEMYAAMLFCEPMQPNEAIAILGAKRYANYDGFGHTLTFAGPFQAKTVDESFRDIIAFDSIHYQKRNSDQEASMGFMMRDLNKCMVAFTPVQGTRYADISTGKWGCGVFNGSA